MSKPQSRTHNQTRWQRRQRQRNRAEAFRLRGGSYVARDESGPVIDPSLAAAAALSAKIRRGSTRRGES